MTQLALALDPTPASEPRLNPTAPADRRTTLQAACWRALERLAEGPATADELRRVAGWRFGARLGELRPWLAWAAGRAPYLAVHRKDRARNPIPEPDGTANPVYRLSPWGIVAARGLLQRRDSTP